MKLMNNLFYRTYEGNSRCFVLFIVYQLRSVETQLSEVVHFVTLL